ncbi:MAG: glycosyltransferase family 2 protein [Gammaproteobacteria bacterium]|nr:glycosyltransferase family 2 protein [Gammaproteobacteria bacterium]
MEKSVRLSISVILPAYNEEAGVGSQVEAIRHVLYSHGMTHEILVIDDGSQDRTAQEAIQAGARVLRHHENRGYGAAIKTGIEGAQYERIVIIDADGTYPADQIPELVAKLETADMVVGARTGAKVHIPWLRRPAKWVLGRLAARITGQPIPDLNSGLRAFRRECAKQYFPILSNRFSFTTTLTLALLADDYRVVYHPINYYRRIGRSKIAPRHFMDFTILVLRMAMLFQPLKVFVPLAFTCGLFGAGKVFFDIMALFQRASIFGGSLLYQPVISTSAILLLLVGLQLLLIGMVADGVVRKIAQHNRPPAPYHGVSSVLELVSKPQVEAPEAILNAKKQAL